jgi:hypothetical protein
MTTTASSPRTTSRIAIAEPIRQALIPLTSTGFSSTETDLAIELVCPRCGETLALPRNHLYPELAARRIALFELEHRQSAETS